MWKVFHRLDDVLLKWSWVPSFMLVLALCMVAVQAADRREPFEILSVEPAAARPGEMVTITAKVRRDTSRDCSARMNRAVFDSTRARFDYPLMTFSHALIDSMELVTPGELRVSVMVPPSAAPGLAELVSVLEYRCNRVHALWPIEVTTTMPLTVLP